MLPNAASEVRHYNQQLADYSLEKMLTWAVETFGDGLVQVTSLGPTGIVILDHLARIVPGPRVVTIDTGFLFPETQELIAQVEQRFALRIELHHPELTPTQQTEFYGPRLWELEPDVCCHERKVKPLAQALHGAQAWISGLRRDQSQIRGATPLVDWDYAHNLVKLNPLATWSASQVWEYIRLHELPYNALHDRGYASIGCTHCTLPALTATDERSGRWQNRVKTECGLHLSAGNGGRPWQACPE